MLRCRRRPNAVGPKEHWTPLCEAAFRGNLLAVDALLNGGARPNLATSFRLATAFEIEGRPVQSISSLHLATIKGHTAFVAVWRWSAGC